VRHGRAGLDVERIHHHDVSRSLAVLPTRHLDLQRVLPVGEVADRDDGRVDLIGRAREEIYFARRALSTLTSAMPMPLRGCRASAPKCR
jgi:hypothetical protein